MTSHETAPSKKTKLWILVAAAAVILALAAALVLTGRGTAPEDLILKNFDPEGRAATAFGTEIPKAEVASITMVGTLKNAPGDAVDVSENGSGKVLLWARENEEGRMDLTIAGDGAVYAPADCSYLFGGREYWLRLKTLDFGGLFHTDNAVTMKAMFYGCPALESLDLTGFRTENVTALDWMFAGCTGLRELDLSAFRTEKVMETGWMFQNCSELETLNLSSFRLPADANTFLMFQNCRSLKNVQANEALTAQVEADS